MYTMECYLAVQRNEVLIHVMSLENIMPAERSQSPNTNYMIKFIEFPDSEIYRTRKEISGLLRAGDEWGWKIGW